MGKSCTLALIGAQLVKNGCTVYSFAILNELSHDHVSQIFEAAKDKSKTIAVLVDEIDSSVGAGNLKKLLKSVVPNLIIIGAAVPTRVKSDNTANFRSKVSMSALTLKKDDPDYNQLVHFFSGELCRRTTSVKLGVFVEICDFLLEYCGGHLYPLMTLLAHISTELSVEHLQSIRAFKEYFFCQQFENGAIYNDIVGRCFDHDSDTKIAAERILKGVNETGDIAIIDRFHWWNNDKNDFISRAKRMP
jgi:hypothetical protein